MLADMRETLYMLNAEYHNANFQKYAEQFERGLPVDDRRCRELRRMMKLWISTWHKVWDHLRDRISKIDATIKVLGSNLTQCLFFCEKVNNQNERKIRAIPTEWWWIRQSR